MTGDRRTLSRRSVLRAGLGTAAGCSVADRPGEPGGF